MKKKYFAPEMEDVKVDEPVLLSMEEGSTGSMTGCPTKTCDSQTCPLEGMD